MNWKMAFGIVLVAGLVAGAFLAMHAGTVNVHAVLLDGGNNGNNQTDGPHPPIVDDPWTMVNPYDPPHPPIIDDPW